MEKQDTGDRQIKIKMTFLWSIKQIKQCGFLSVAKLGLPLKSLLTSHGKKWINVWGNWECSLYFFSLGACRHSAWFKSVWVKGKCVNILSTKLSEKEGRPCFLVKSCSSTACITAIPCWEESKARCCSIGAATSQRKILNFCLLVVLFKRTRCLVLVSTWQRQYFLAQNLFLSSLWRCNFKSHLSPSLPPPFPSHFLSFCVYFRPLFSCLLKTCQAKPVTHITVGLTWPYR